MLENRIGKRLVTAHDYGFQALAGIGDGVIVGSVKFVRIPLVRMMVERAKVMGDDKVLVTFTDLGVEYECRIC